MAQAHLIQVVSRGLQLSSPFLILLTPAFLAALEGYGVELRVYARKPSSDANASTA